MGVLVFNTWATSLRPQLIAGFFLEGFSDMLQSAALCCCMAIESCWFLLQKTRFWADKTSKSVFRSVFRQPFVTQSPPRRNGSPPRASRRPEIRQTCRWSQRMIEIELRAWGREMGLCMNILSCTYFFFYILTEKLQTFGPHSFLMIFGHGFHQPTQACLKTNNALMDVICTWYGPSPSWTAEVCQVCATVRNDR